MLPMTTPINTVSPTMKPAERRPCAPDDAVEDIAASGVVPSG
jgi:hypothetical protein